MMDIDLKWLLPIVLPFALYLWPIVFFTIIGIEVDYVARVGIGFFAFVIGSAAAALYVLIELKGKTITLRKILGAE